MDHYAYKLWEMGTAIITAYYGNERRITIPDQVDGHIVTALGKGAFQNHRELLTVIVPDSVIRIEDGAFAGCVSLLGVFLPASVRQMGEGMFDGCQQLKIFTVSDSLALAYACERKLPYAYGASSAQLAAVVHKLIPQYICGPFVYIINEAGQATIAGYRDQGQLNELIIPEALDGHQVKAIGKKAFAGHKTVKAFVIPDCVESIGESAFEECSVTERVVLHPGLRQIGSLAFARSRLKELILPDTVTHIGTEFCRFCRELVTVRLSKGLERIPARAFSDCRSLKHTCIPNGVRFIDYCAFADTHHEAELMIPQSVEQIDPCAFALCVNLRLGVYPESAGEDYAKAQGIKTRLITLP